MTVKAKSRRSTVARAADKLYKWGGMSFPVPAQVVGEELARLASVAGEVTSKIVLEEARDPANPMHPCFEWDDEKAAEVHRMAQARTIIRSVRVVVTNGDTRSKEYAYVHVTDAEGPRYVPAERVRSEDDIRQSAIEEALTQIEGLQRRLGFIQELRPVFTAAQKVRASLKGDGKQK